MNVIPASCCLPGEELEVLYGDGFARVPVEILACKLSLEDVEMKKRGLMNDI
jgi:hypothetical protein